MIMISHIAFRPRKEKQGKENVSVFLYLRLGVLDVLLLAVNLLNVSGVTVVK